MSEYGVIYEYNSRVNSQLDDALWTIIKSETLVFTLDSTIVCLGSCVTSELDRHPLGPDSANSRHSAIFSISVVHICFIPTNKEAILPVAWAGLRKNLA